MKDKKIAVLMGGPSAEREVSLNTGKAILNALQEKGYNAVGIDLEPNRVFDQLRENKIEFVFNAIHGKYGEDGMLQGALDMLGIRYTGSGVLASAIAMDKGISKRLFIAAGVPTPRSHLFDCPTEAFDQQTQIEAEFNFPVVIKPASQGSSIGVRIVNEKAEFRDALEEAFSFSRQVLVEEFVKGKEVTVAVYGNEAPQALPVIQIVPHSGRYDYHSKYTKGATEYLVPAPLSPRLTEEIQAVAVRTFKLLGCRGVARVDIMLDEQDRPFVLEVNTIPGMTATSLVPKAAAASGISFPELCERLLLMAAQ
jgi:D-alanine--D-alanine ligase